MKPRLVNQTPEQPKKEPFPLLRTSTTVQSTIQATKPKQQKNAAPLFRLLAKAIHKAQVAAFTRIQMRDTKKPKVFSTMLLNNLLKQKLRDNFMAGMYALTRNIVRLSIKCDLPEQFRKELSSLQNIPKLEPEIHKQIYKVGANTEKGVILIAIQNLLKKHKEELAGIDSCIADIVNLAETIQKGGYDLKDLNMWYRNNSQRMTPQTKKFKNVLIKLLEIVAINEKQKKNKGEAEKKIRDLQFKVYEQTRKSTHLEKDLNEKLTPWNNEVNTVAALIGQKKFGQLKIENGKGKFPHLADMIQGILEYLDSFPAPIQFTDTEQIAAKAQQLFEKPKPMYHGDIEKFLIATQQARLRISTSQNKTTKQVAKILKLLERLCNAMKEIQEETSKKLYSRIEQQSMINKNVDRELKKARGEIQTYKEELEKQKTSFAEGKEQMQARYDLILQKKQTQIDQLQQRNRILQENNDKHNYMLQGLVKPEHDNNFVQKPLAPKPSMKYTDSQIYIEPTSASTYEFQIDRLRKELDTSNRQTQRLNQVIRKLEESYRSYEQETFESKQMLRKFKQKMAIEERLAEEREFGPLTPQTVEVGVETSMKSLTQLNHQELVEAGRRVLQLEEALSNLRDQHSNDCTRIKQYETRIQQLNVLNKKILQQRNEYQLQYEALQKQRKIEESIVLSKRKSFGQHVFPYQEQNHRANNKAVTEYSFAMSLPGHQNAEITQEVQEQAQQFSENSQNKKIRKSQFTFSRGGSSIVPRINSLVESPIKDKKESQIDQLLKQKEDQLRIIDQYKKNMKQYVQILKQKDEKLIQLQKKIDQLQGGEGVVKQLIKSQGKIYDLEFQIYQFELKYIKQQNTIQKLEKKIESQAHNLSQVRDQRNSLKRQLKQMNKKILKSSVHNKMQNSKTGKEEQMQQEINENDHDNELLNLLKAEDLRLPTTPSEQVYTLTSIIMRQLIDIYNGYISLLKKNQLQELVELYVVKMEKGRFEEMLNTLFSFVRLAQKRTKAESALLPQNLTGAQDSSMEDIKTKFIRKMGWQKLIPLMKAYAQNPSPDQLSEIKYILNR